MATVSISQLDTATQAKVDDLYEVAVVDENSQTGYASRKLTAAQIATLIAQGVQFSGLSTEAKTIIAAINEAAQNGGSEVEPNPAGEPTDTLEKIGIDGTVYEVGGSEPVSKTVTGNPIHIEDAADAPIVSGEVTFEPKQDLHGYDKPWAAGAGKNKLNIDNLIDSNIRGVDFVVAKNSSNAVISVSANGAVTVGTYADYYIVGNEGVYDYANVPSGTYILNGGVSSNAQIYVVSENEGVVAFSNGEDTTAFNMDSSKKYRILLRISGSVSNVKLYPMIRLSTETDATFEPYSNICPITGYDDCEVEVTGKNLLENKATMPFISKGVTFTQNPDGSITANGTAINGNAVLLLLSRITNSVHLPRGEYTYKVCPSRGSLNTFYGQFQCTRDGSLYSFGFDYGDGVIASVLNTDVIQATIVIANGTTVNNLTFYPQIELGTEATSYEPYQSKTYPIDLDGTRYGGKVDFNTGVMTVDRAIVDFDGSDVWRASQTTGRYIYAVNDGKLGNEAYKYVKTSHYPYGTLSSPDAYCCDNESGVLRIIFNTSFATKADWLSYLTTQNTEGTPLQICYPLATPFTVQLTPEQIRTLKGTNNISTNMTDMSLEYITESYQPLVELIERSAGHHYSTQERVIGTWIDGKPLYERIYQVSLSSFVYNAWTNIGVTLSNVDLLIDTKATRVPTTSVPNPVTFSVIGTVEQDTTNVKIMNLRNVDYGTDGIDMFVTLQYTKTTD